MIEATGTIRFGDLAQLAYDSVPPRAVLRIEDGWGNCIHLPLADRESLIAALGLVPSIMPAYMRAERVMPS